MAKQMTQEEIERVKAYRRQLNRNYWDKMDPEERKRKRHEAYERFWGKMTAEERKAKRLEYDLSRAAAAEKKAD